VAGLLDPKSRMLDSRITSEGRRRIANGTFAVRYVSVSDVLGSYQGDSAGVYVDRDTNLSFESAESPFDTIVPITDDDSFLIPYLTMSGTLDPRKGASTVAGQKAVAGVSKVTSGAIEAISNSRIAKTKDPIVNDPGLLSSPAFYRFKLEDSGSFKDIPSEASVDDVESLMADFRLSTRPNFMFLPPVQAGGNSLGTYKDIREQTSVSPQDFFMELSASQPAKLNFSPRTDTHSLVLQVFEENSGSLGKLEIIEYGSASFGNEMRRVYFAGKMMNDGFDAPTFVNLFTLTVKE
jgi:hypothetical protein